MKVKVGGSYVMSLVSAEGEEVVVVGLIENSGF